jgi:hypothetical protein
LTQSARQAQDNNVTLVLIIVVIVFSVCQAPALLNQILWNVLDSAARECGGFQFYFSRICNMLVVFNSAINFPIYAVFNTRFRQVLVGQVLVLCCRRRSTSIRQDGSMRTPLAGGCGSERFKAVAQPSVMLTTVGKQHQHRYTVMDRVSVADGENSVGEKQPEVAALPINGQQDAITLL